MFPRQKKLRKRTKKKIEKIFEKYLTTPKPYAILWVLVGVKNANE